MASKMADTDICLVCFESRPLKIVGKCKHTFCTKCLTTVLEHDKGKVFPCPACKVDCPHPGSIEQLVDYTGEDGADSEGQSLAQGSRPDGEEMQHFPKEGNKDGGKATHDKVSAIALDVKCVICHHRKEEAQAVNLCVACGHLHMCKDCTVTHANTKATQGHVVVRLKFEESVGEALCEIHHSPLNSFCHECGKAVCMVCVMLDHNDHSIKSLADVVDTKVETLKVTLEKRLKRLKELQGLKNEMISVKKEAPMLDKQDELIKEIEDHAQKCIDQIVKLKEGLKNQVKTKYKMIRDVSDDLEKVSTVVQSQQGPTERAQALLGKTEHHPKFLKKVIGMQHDLDAIGMTGDDISGAGYWDQVCKLHDHECTFTPENSLVCLGKLNKENRNVQHLNHAKEIFHLSIPVDSQDMFVPCVANLGQKFVVAHPTRQGELSKGIDIYDIPGTLTQTLTEDIPPFYDMCATPDDNLAVLAEANGGTSCSVKVFDAKTWDIRSTSEIDITKPLSLAVDMYEQYIILSDIEGQKHITVFDKNGVKRLPRHFIKEVENPTRIACGGRFIFVMGGRRCDCFEIVDTGIHRIVTCVDYNRQDIPLLAISATIWGDFFFVGMFQAKRYIVVVKWAKKKENKWFWGRNLNLCRPTTTADRQCRASVSGSHIVVSHGQTIKVYKM